MSVYNYENIQDLLKGLLQNYPGRKKPINLRVLSEELGYKSPRTVAMVINGQRQASTELVTRIQYKLKLTEKESHYINLLSQKNRSLKKVVDHKEVETKISSIKNSKKKYQHVTNDIFQYISKWYFSPLMLMVKNDDSPNFEDLAERLRNKISVSELKQAYELLKRLGFVGQNKMARETSFDIPSAAIQQHHREMMARASESVSEQLMTSRELSSSTLQMKPEKIELAKTRIREFVKDFISEFHEADAESVYQMNLQFFKHTKD